MGCGMKKRGLSPVVASMLLILLAIVLAILIFLWSRGFFFEQVEKFGKPVDLLCASVSFKIDRVNATGNTGYDTLEVLNTGDINIYGFEIKKHYEGNSEVMIVDLAVPAGKVRVGEAYMRMEGSSIVPDRVEVFPILSGTVRGQASRVQVSCSSSLGGVPLNPRD